MESLLNDLEPLLSNPAVRYGAAALVGFILGWLVRGLKSRPAVVAATPDADTDAAVAKADVQAEDTAIGALGEPVSSLPGLTDPLAGKLAAAGIETLGDLWARGQDSESLHALADSVQLEDFVLRKWVNAADLARIEGVTPALAEALIHCGVRTTAALAGENPDRVQNKLAGYEGKKKTLGGAPDRTTVVALIEAAASVHD